MPEPRRQFEVVADDIDPGRPMAAPRTESAALGLLLLSIKALSQRAVTALADLFTLLTVASAFWLWMSIPEPNDRQIISLSIYAVFVLAANAIVRRK